MRKILLVVGVLTMSLVATVAVAAQGIGTEKSRIESDTETIIVEESNGTPIVFIDGTQVSSGRRYGEIVRANEKAAESSARQQAISDLETLVQDMIARPSVNPDLAQIEAAVIALSELH